MPSKQYSKEETALSFKSSGGSAVLTLTSLANNTLRVSAQYDRGTGSLPTRHRVRIRVKLGATTTGVVIGNPVSVYLATADTTDATKVDGNVGQSDANATSIDKRRNLQFVVLDEVDKTAAAADEWIASGMVDIEARYISVCVANESGNALSSTATDHEVTITPYVPEMQ